MISNFLSRVFSLSIFGKKKDKEVESGYFRLKTEHVHTDRYNHSAAVSSSSKNDNFALKKKSSRDVEIKTASPMELTPENLKLLSTSILISMEMPIDSKDLKFIGASRIDGSFFYAYTGKDFGSFPHQYEEVFSEIDFENIDRTPKFYYEPELNRTLKR